MANDARPITDVVATDADIYRREALDYFEAGRFQHEILRSPRGWALHSFYLLVALAAATMIFLALGHLSVYAEGPALIRSTSARPVVASRPGVIDSIAVGPGQVVSAGEPLFRMGATEEEATLAALERDYTAAVVRMLLNPADVVARQQVASARSQRVLAEDRLRSRTVSAPFGGTVSDVFVTPGQSVGAGDTLITMADSAARFSIIAFLPGHAQPSLKTGQPLRFEVSGYQYAYVTAVIDKVDQQVIGPHEVRRVIGGQLADAVAVGGPVVVVRASLQERDFRAGKERYAFSDGMHGNSRVVIRRESLLSSLVPGLRQLETRGQ